MDEPPSSVPLQKKVIFTTARKKANHIETNGGKGEVSAQVPDTKPTNVKSNPKPKKKELKEPKVEIDVPKAISIDESSKDEIKVKILSAMPQDKKTKKPPRRRKPSDAKNDSEVCKEMEYLSVSPGNCNLSVEAAPFVPSSQKISTPKPKQQTSNAKERKAVSRPKPVPKSESDLRSVEIKQLQIRFSPTGFSQKKNFVDDSIVMNCVLPITDPDFAYDLASIRLEICLPKDYPGSKSTPIRPLFSILNSDLPTSITSRIERNMKWGLNSLEGGILVCRPMLRYLEDHLEKWMIEDGRDSFIKFVKPNEIKVTDLELKKELESEIGTVEESSDFAETCISNQSNPTFISASVQRISKGDWIAPAPVSDQSSVGGQPYTLKMIFSTIRGVDLLTSQLLSFLASCDRCKFNFPVEDLRPFVDRIEHCPKCTAQTKFYYKSQLVTPSGNYEDDDDGFETILGTVRFLRAKPVDLLPTLYQCACSRCYGTVEETENVSSSCKIERVKIGENINYGCFSCHHKIRFQIDRIEWISELVPGMAAASEKKSSSRNRSGPALSVGSPLPLNGACEHYKKSFRWYRFPCCGQAFPCDECHKKDPVAKDHPVEWANRFICGFCSREQSISIKECPECGKDTSAAGRKHTTFWEGGKGVRNQVSMSRKDSKKYKNYSLNSKNKKKET